jgi:hypothetical protein
VELRTAEGQDLRVLSGYAALFDTEAEIAGLFVERIAPGAFRAALARPDDVRALFNHDPSLLLGRVANGTLRLTEDARGLRYEVDLNPTDPDAQRVLAKVSRGDVTQSSFGFRVTQADPFTVRSDGKPLRVIREVELFDVSPVTYPAYEETSVSARDAARAASAVPTAPTPAAVSDTLARRLAWHARLEAAHATR